MKYINKNIAANLSAFNTIIDPYLEKDLYRYDNLSDSDRIALRKILESEQQCCCAYCMAYLTLEKGTTDHIIPKKINAQDYNRAYGLGKGLYRRDFIYEGRFTTQAVGIYYPHTLAYGNLVFACDDCNKKKDQDLMIPIFFMTDSSNTISYTSKGLLKTSPSNAIPTGLKSWLNSDVFMLYRAMWRAAAILDISIETIQLSTEASVRHELIDTMKRQLVIPSQKHIADGSLNSKGGWKRFLQFQWFWNYYKQQQTKS